MNQEPIPPKNQFLAAAIQVLRAADHPLTTREITDEAVRLQLLPTSSKTPRNSMAALLSKVSRRSPMIERVSTDANQSGSGTARWRLPASPDPSS